MTTELIIACRASKSSVKDKTKRDLLGGAAKKPRFQAAASSKTSKRRKRKGNIAAGTPPTRPSTEHIPEFKICTQTQRVSVHHREKQARRRRRQTEPTFRRSPATCARAHKNPSRIKTSPRNRTSPPVERPLSSFFLLCFLTGT